MKKLMNGEINEQMNEGFNRNIRVIFNILI